MSKNKDTIGSTIFVIVVLCFVCSIVVSATAVLLKPMQQDNVRIDKMQYILEGAGFDADVTDGKPNVATLNRQQIQETYSRYIETKVVDLETGQYDLSIDPETYDFKKAMRDKTLSVAAKQDFAKVRRVPKKAFVYLVKDDENQIENVIIPIQGTGLWSMMYAYVALEKDLNTIKSLVYYEQAETAGLGAEVQNPVWQKKWHGKKIYNSEGDVAVRISKSPADVATHYGVDAIAGATLTGDGVNNSFKFWFGDEGYKPYLMLRRQEGVL
ncbi:MAG: Na(+)-translocating NADH-quinone reductase subunit C [Shewanellaceae bacterium]|nr:Na(+)-translocating NADH-quinone reductase subunit C [Shewanellaceae bacterium]